MIQNIYNILSDTLSVSSIGSYELSVLFDIVLYVISFIVSLLVVLVPLLICWALFKMCFSFFRG